jgi:hypothetical protein
MALHLDGGKVVLVRWVGEIPFIACVGRRSMMRCSISWRNGIESDIKLSISPILFLVRSLFDYTVWRRNTIRVSTMTSVTAGISI